MEHLIRNHRHYRDFTVIPNTILRDECLTFFEKGLLCYLLSLPDNWEIRVDYLASHFGETERKILGALKSLINAGYCKRIAKREGGRLSGQYYQITDIPNDFSAPAKNEGAENSASQNFSPTENSAPQKNEGAIINKESLFEEINTDNEEKKRARATIEKKCFFIDSKFFDFELFASQFKQEYKNVDLRYYYEAVKDWSAKDGVKKQDWIATARGFMRRDFDAGHLHIIKANNGSGLSQDAINYIQSMMEL